MFKVLRLIGPGGIFVCLVVVIFGYSWHQEKQEKINWSPCGQVNLTNIYMDLRGDLVFRYFDDGKRVWQIKRVKPPVSDGAPPVVEMGVVFERSPHNCTIWKMEHGIKD